jgi:hypothetical protein
MQLPEEQLTDGNYGGMVNRPALYRAIGVRLYILWEHSQQQQYATLARTYFDRVVLLTEGSPYQVDRQRAKDFIAKLTDKEAKRGAGKK